MNSLLARANDYHLDNCILYIYEYDIDCVERDWETVVAGLNIWSYEDLGYDYLKKTNLCNLFKYRKSTMFIPSVISLLTIIEKFEYEQIDWKKFVYLNLYKL